MIVVDANILVYSLIEGGYTPLVHKLRERDMDWRTTGLCLHEILPRLKNLWVVVTHKNRLSL